MPVAIKRVYEAASEADGQRILVDRLWPRGISHERAQLSAWEKEVAPTAQLRTWFNHEPSRMAEFTRRYRHELDTLAPAQEAVGRLLELLGQGTKITLVYGAKDPTLNQARVLADYLHEKTVS
ncbi:Uncharacterized conserved protein YeaO, DUF488 family [Propionibacterium cyclohexanicum]|uniref:Uncharacterized conserved protein YeaO, DUF488 family n=1 Tax=Propionibacterium cyclohexanicum TaxID=64702 RepID=A0A1H9RIQ0_9ACTN|nr:DUF488 family protein [Propionibacterium cyclohexanicum]SER72584.1 Uncharacterized conserved protein YeaO, DUF488 family [Propionibacterium cyclohexanicum]